MTLRELIEEMDVGAASGNLETPVAGLAYDSRRVRSGDAFFALAGTRQDGARFVGDALAAGAVAVIGLRGLDARDTARIEVAEPRLAMAQAANRFHGHPSRALRAVAVTGTNGKTTTTWMLESIFRAAGWNPGLIGTTGVRFAGTTRAAAFTTPEAPELQALLADMVAAGVQAVAMEVSSHALVQRRAWGIDFDVCVFTNLTQDHLDYHGTMEAYLDAKLMLFDGRNGGGAKPRSAVVNAGDPHVVRVMEGARGSGARVVAFALGAEAGDLRVDVRVESVAPTPGGMDVDLVVDARGAGVHDRGPHRLHLPMIGAFNALNAAGAWGAALALGIPPGAIRTGLESMPGVPGRLERVEAGQPFTVAVDYAHTPDALERALVAARGHAAGRLVVVFGCGGDRDRGKRPRMGEVAARLADVVWVTSDNPRSEDPAAIVAEVVAGAGGARELHAEVDRRAAIGAALAAARAGDVVLIAGKGHETTQTIGERVLPFDDRQVAREILTGGRAA